jgi:iron-sulfur cluster repair protein YtfE (RIC family)
MSEQCVRHLQAEHARFMEAFAALEEWLRKAQAATPLSQQEWQQARERFESFAREVALHIRKEEQVLFPALEAYLPRDVGPLAVLRGEHRDISGHLGNLLESLGVLASEPENRRAGQSFLNAGRAMLQLVYDHLYKENRVLFPMVARFLSPERDTHLLQQMEILSASQNSVPAAPGSR